MEQIEKRPNNCCNEEMNLVKLAIAQDKIMETCKVCNCRHYIVEADMGVFTTIIGN